MTNPNLEEHVLSINDYYEASEQVKRVKEKLKEGRKLSAKDKAILTILTLAADAVAAQHRSVDLYRSLLFPSNVQVNDDTIDRLKKFHSMIAQGLRVTKAGNLVGEEIAIEAILSDFETTFTAELAR